LPADPVQKTVDRRSPHHEKGGSGGVVRILHIWCRLLFLWNILIMCAAKRVSKAFSANFAGRNCEKNRSRKCLGATPAWATIRGPGRPFTNLELQCAPRGAAYPVPGNRISGSQNGGQRVFWFFDFHPVHKTGVSVLAYEFPYIFQHFPGARASPGSIFVNRIWNTPGARRRCHPWP
jgi:hypothetical protein